MSSLIQELDDQTTIMSSTSMMLETPAAVELVARGRAAVPELIDALRNEEAVNAVMAVLAKIYDEPPPNGDVDAMKKAWLASDLVKYDPYQPRDDHGKWVAAGGGVSPEHEAAVRRAAYAVPREHMEFIKGIPIIAKKRAGEELLSSANATGLFDHPQNDFVNGKIYAYEESKMYPVFQPDGTTKFARTKFTNVEATTVHEIGHAVDYRTGWKLGDEIASQVDRDAMDLSGTERANAAYWLSNNHEKWAETYAAAYGPEDSRHFGGLSKAATRRVFAKSIEMVKAARLVPPVTKANECREPAGSPEGGQFCGSGAGARPKMSFVDRGMKTVGKNKVLAGINAIPADHAELIKDVPIYAWEKRWPGNDREAQTTRGMFSFGGHGDPKVELTRTRDFFDRDGKQSTWPITVEDIEGTTVHELGHALDHATKWRLGQEFSESIGTDARAMTSKERISAHYWLSDDKERFAELYKLGHSPRRSGQARLFGGMSVKRAEKVFAKSLAKLRLMNVKEFKSV